MIYLKCFQSFLMWHISLQWYLLYRVLKNDLVVAQIENLPPHNHEAKPISLCHDRFIRKNIFTPYVGLCPCIVWPSLLLDCLVNIWELASIFWVNGSPPPPWQKAARTPMSKETNQNEDLFPERLHLFATVDEFSNLLKSIVRVPRCHWPVNEKKSCFPLFWNNVLIG